MDPQVAMAARQTSGKQSADSLRDEVRATTLEHMLQVIGAARPERRPFPHLIVEGILPDALYWELVGSLPDARLYAAFGYGKHATGGVSNRGRFALDGANLGHLLGRQRSLWYGVRDALGAWELKAAVFGKLAEGLAYRFGISRRAAAEVPGYPLPELFRETRGYTIKPHSDTRRKLVTMQIALPRDDSQRGLGTEFYRRSFNPLALLHQPRGFEVVKRVPFLPNVGYAFTVINTWRLKSWHGRTMLAGNAGVRNTILNIWYAAAKDANAELVEQYYRPE